MRWRTASNGVMNAESAFDKLTHTLATAAVQRDQHADWHLIDNPKRLRIQTIDALCASLTRQMPVLSRFGSQPEVTAHPQMLYIDAVRATIALLNDNVDIADDIAQLLTYLDNDMVRVEKLLTAMLARRDHWLRHIHHGRTQQELEESFQNLRSYTVDQLCDLFPDELYDELTALIRYAVANLSTEQKASAILLCDDMDKWPDTVDHWCGIAELLLKADGNWRERIDARQGFPAGKTKAEKEVARTWKVRLTQLIDRFKTSRLLQCVLQDVRRLPPAVYTDAQWQMLGAIMRLLPYAVAQLKIIFQSTGKIDFTEVMQSALMALGESEAPTDLSLALDYQIKHVLIDEFQDTSISQYQLIEKLVAAWVPDDGRSLFAVGDPMQSIYRFREAEVGLFLRARHIGIGPVALQPITLSSNFRSQLGIVDWVNTTFNKLMPTFEDYTVGAVAYSSSVAMHSELEGAAVTVHPFFEKNRKAEADKVVDIILQSRQRNPSESIAILVRNRSHLSEVVTSLKSFNLSFRAVEIEALNHKSVVQDLYMLTRALINPADRLAWLAILRAPWCGLRLDDLQVLVTSNNQVDEKSHTIFELIRDKKCRQRLSKDGANRLQHIVQVLTQCIKNRYRQSLYTTVEAAWLALGGVGCTREKSIVATSSTNSDEQYSGDLQTMFSFEDAEVFFNYLEQHECAGNILDWDNFEAGLSRLYASTALDTDANLQVMTIHKAKGLEFDTVLVPGLGLASRNKEKQLLRWMEQPRWNNRDEKSTFGIDTVDLFLAPIQEAGEKNDRINQWLERHEREKENYEIDRLLYVAATRAKKFLHLLGHVNLGEQDGKLMSPRSGSLLDRLWPAVDHVYRNTVPREPEDLEDSKKYESIVDQSILRLKSGWQLPMAPDPVRWKPIKNVIALDEEIAFSWANEVAKHVGSVVHRWLQCIAEDQLQGWDVKRIQSMREQITYGLLKQGLGVEEKVLAQAVEHVVTALINTVTDPRGRWILSKQRCAQNEFRLTGSVNDDIIEYVVDRTFCDDSNTRWIIDYKTSMHDGPGVHEFLDRELERYRSQLNNYAAFFRTFEKKSIHLGLYFPMLREWRTWEY